MSKIKNIIAVFGLIAGLASALLPQTASASSSTMQGFDDNMCAAMSTGSSVTLTDTRDGNTYTVRKLADGNCWMVDNLKLQGRTISSADSNLPSGDTISIPSSSTADWCTDATQACYEQLMTLDATDTSISGQSSAQSSYGVYYNWYTATATYGAYDTTSGDVAYSVCPKGWRLPKGGSSGEFQSLYTEYPSASGMLSSTGPAFVLSGYRSGSSTYGQGSDGYYWSSTANNNNFAYRLDLYSSSVYPANSYYKYYGHSVRCVLDHPVAETTVTATLEDVISMRLVSSQSLGDKTYECHTASDSSDPSVYQSCSGQDQLVSTTILPSQDDKTTMYTDVYVSTNVLAGFNLTMKDSDNNNSLQTIAGDTISAISSEPVGGTTPGWAVKIDNVNTWYAVPAANAANSLTIKTHTPSPAAVSVDVHSKVTYGVAASDTQASGTYTDTVVYTATTR